MYIEELSARTGNKSVTVTMSYDECRDIANGLYHISKEKGTYTSIYTKMQTLFDLVKEGKIMPHTIEKLAQEQEKERVQEAEKNKAEYDTRP